MQLLTLKQVYKMLGMCRTSFYYMRKDDKQFPKGLTVNGKIRFDEKDIEYYIATRKAITNIGRG